MSIIVCKTRLLTPNQAATAMRRGMEVNPANAIAHATLAPAIGRRRPMAGVAASAAWLSSSRGAGPRPAPT
jgi:hypothetical protein